jgi:hypothetical protein
MGDGRHRPGTVAVPGAPPGAEAGVNYATIGYRNRYWRHCRGQSHRTEVEPGWRGLTVTCDALHRLQDLQTPPPEYSAR